MYIYRERRIGRTIYKDQMVEIKNENLVFSQDLWQAVSSFEWYFILLTGAIFYLLQLDFHRVILLKSKKQLSFYDFLSEKRDNKTDKIEK